MLVICFLILLQEDYAESVLAVLARFGYDIKKLDGSKIHSLHNVMTLITNFHGFFAQLNVWFEATSVSSLQFPPSGFLS